MLGMMPVIESNIHAIGKANQWFTSYIADAYVRVLS